MTKSELIEMLAQEINVTSEYTYSLVNTILTDMTETLVKGQNIQIRGIGSFSVKKYGPYIGRNPKTGEHVEIKSKRIPRFKAGKALIEQLNQGKS